MSEGTCSQIAAQIMCFRFFTAAIDVLDNDGNNAEIVVLQVTLLIYWLGLLMLFHTIG